MVVRPHSFLRKQPAFPFSIRPLGHIQSGNSMLHIAHSYSHCRANFTIDYSFLVFKSPLSICIRQNMVSGINKLLVTLQSFHIFELHVALPYEAVTFCASR